MKKKNNKQPRPARRALLIRFSVLILTCWLLLCSFLTFYVADDMCDQMDGFLNEFSKKALDINSDGIFIGESISQPGYVEYRFLSEVPAAFTRRLQRSTPFMLKPYPNNVLFEQFVDIYEPFFVLHDWTNNCITSESFAMFQYTVTSGSRNDGITEGYGFASDFGLEFWKRYDVGVPSKLQSNSYWDAPFDCLRGYFIGNQFFPSNTSPDGVSLVEIDISDADYPHEHYTHEYDPVVIDGVEYSSVIDYATNELTILDHYHATGNLFEKVITRTGWTRDFEYIYHVGYRFHPLQYAVTRLLPFILITLALAVYTIMLLADNVHHRLLHPIHQILYKQDASIVHSDQFWLEGTMLKQQFGQLQQQLAEANAEVQRLNTALEYAADAEENRRQLVSNLTHELKTPLAVIHSYAEGLQAGIAKDKQDRYLSVITEESERMDAMVLQMLDLSRLEAGRVKLSMSSFSLLSAAKSVTDKFAPMLEARNLTLAYEQEEDIAVTADEERILQVITNLVSNAFKYAPINSQIQVRVGYYSESSHFHVQQADEQQRICFTIKNLAEPLSDEALEKVWSSFYRTDPSRSEPGTGLGLAIAKSIIDLHGGACIARNTLRIVDKERQTGVEFGFTLPLN